MLKIEKNNKICVLLLSAAISLPLMGCAENKSERKIYNYNEAIITNDENGSYIHLTEDMKEKINNCTDETISIMVDDNEITLETSLVKRKIEKAKQKKIAKNIISGPLFYSALGLAAVCEHKKKKTNKR